MNIRKQRTKKGKYFAILFLNPNYGNNINPWDGCLHHKEGLLLVPLSQWLKCSVFCCFFLEFFTKVLLTW